MRYHLELTGFVGSENFNSKAADKVLRQYPGKHVDVLIDSLGGSLAHGLSIAGGFRNHGDVTAHLRGMCASAATIAAMGAKHICIEPDAFFLVHRVLMNFFEWSSHNADSLQQYIEALQESKKDLETLDASVAETYASRCKKPVNELLDLMKDGKWLTAKQALEWGFVDEILSSDNSRNSVSKLTKAQANAFAAQGLPLPPIEIEPENSSFISEIVNSLKTFFKMENQQNNSAPQPESNQTPESAPVNETQKPEANQSQADDLEALKAENASLKAKLEEMNKKPGDSTASAVSTPEPKQPEAEPENEITEFFKANKEASDLFNSLP